MQFFKYWTRANRSVVGKHGTFDVSCCGYSNESLEDALRLAEQRAESTAKRLANAEPVHDNYYGTNAMQEEVVESFEDDGNTIAIISRNRYGCLVLNTPHVFFADVDKPKSQSSGVTSILGMFGFGKKQETPTAEAMLIQTIQESCRNNRSLGLRLYRTMNGYRVILTSETIPADQPRSQELLKSFRSDGLYMLLCKTQQCYRARLTPKPWRCGSSRPPFRFPFQNDTQEHAYRKWETAYENIMGNFATCAFIGQFGSPDLHPEVEKIVQLHDHFVLDGEKPLA